MLPGLESLGRTDRLLLSSNCLETLTMNPHRHHHSIFFNKVCSSKYADVITLSKAREFLSLDNIYFTLELMSQRLPVSREAYYILNGLDYSRGANRREIYRSNRWVMFSILSGFRPSFPEYYMQHPYSLGRLQEWIRRELAALAVDINYFMISGKILKHSQKCYIICRSIYDFLKPVLGKKTRHFLYELYNFATSFYDIEVYDVLSEYGDRPSSVDSGYIDCEAPDDLGLSNHLMILEIRPKKEPTPYSRATSSASSASRENVFDVDSDSSDEVIVGG